MQVLMGAKLRRVFWTTLLVLLLASKTATAQTCGCDDCTTAVLALDANGQTCQTRLDSQLATGATQDEACAHIAERYPLTCGPACHPTKCDDQAPAHCSCEACTDAVWSTSANGFTCGQRVLFLLGPSNTEDQACARVAEQYPTVCGVCHPDTCPTAAPTTSMPVTTAPPTVLPPPQGELCGCFACTAEILQHKAGGFTCLQRMDFLQTAGGGNLTELDACARVADEFPDNICGPACHPVTCTTLSPTSSPTRAPPEFCTCYDCNATVLNTTVNGFTCAERMRFLQTASGGRSNETEACQFVAEEFRDECGLCHPQTCDGRSGVLPPMSWRGMAGVSLALLWLTSALW